ncbi:MAG: cytochrome bc complex cytochrome b subunit [Polyangiaceae bacterium]|nr:cytochrome bc complex cytochrome b subunit [Polyangiaceae bacterium]
MTDPIAPIPREALDALPPETTRLGRAGRALLSRYPVWPVIDYFRHKSVPQHRHSAWYSVGGIVLFFFAVQLVTGILLMVYYRPSQPWQSVQRIVNEVPYGNVVRSLHHWAANLMILAVFVHLFSTFFLKAYRPPREGTWLTGLGLLGLSMAFGFSGYLLPWDDLSFFATRVGISELEKAPVLGTWIADLARGGDDVTVDTIGRFYPLHVVVLPLLVMGLVSVHVLFVQLQGMSAPDRYYALPPERKKSVSFFGEYLFAEIPIWLLMGALLAFLATFFPRGLSPEADPTAPAPPGIKPEWYFLSQYQALKLFPGKLELVGMVLLGGIPMLAFALPFIDRAIPTNERGRTVTGLGFLALMGLVGMTIWGWWS